MTSERKGWVMAKDTVAMLRVVAISVTIVFAVTGGIYVLAMALGTLGASIQVLSVRTDMNTLAIAEHAKELDTTREKMESSLLMHGVGNLRSFDKIERGMRQHQQRLSDINTKLEVLISRVPERP